VACAAALATIELLEDGLVANAAAVGGYLKERLTELQPKHAAIADVRGLGLMIGVEFGRTDGSGISDGALRDRVMLKCFEKGLLLLGCGESTLRFCPPLMVTRQEVATAVEIFDSAVSETC
jgi:4-aminobutyrate aminotransferase